MMKRLAVAISCAAMLLAACGGADTETSEPDPTPTRTTSISTSPAPTSTIETAPATKDQPAPASATPTAPSETYAPAPPAVRQIAYCTAPGYNTVFTDGTTADTADCEVEAAHMRVQETIHNGGYCDGVTCTNSLGSVWPDPRAEAGVVGAEPLGDPAAAGG